MAVFSSDGCGMTAGMNMLGQHTKGTFRITRVIQVLGS